mgnify:CR=1 FL=1
MEKKEFIHVGTFGQPQGLKGEVKVNIFTSSLESFEKFSGYFIDENRNNLNISKIKKIGKRYVCSLNECKDRNAALLFNGKKIFALRMHLPKVKSNEYYIIDLIDCNVINKENILIGKVIDIKNFGAGDLIEIQNEKKNTYYIPMNKDNLISVDLLEKIIKVNPMLGLLD